MTGPDMSSITIDDQTLRSLLKEVLIEVLQERPALLGDVIAEAIEDAWRCDRRGHRRCGFVSGDQRGAANGAG